MQEDKYILQILANNYKIFLKERYYSTHCVGPIVSMLSLPVLSLKKCPPSPAAHENYCLGYGWGPFIFNFAK